MCCAFPMGAISIDTEPMQPIEDEENHIVRYDLDSKTYGRLSIGF